MAAVARRVTYTKGVDGLWRVKVQSTGWRTMFASQIGTDDRRTLERLVRRKWPDAEVVVVE